MTETEFTDYILEKMWRVGDVDLTAAMPRLLQEVNSRIDRDVLLYSAPKMQEFTAGVDGRFTIPNLKRIKTVYSPDRKAALYYMEPNRVISDTPHPQGYTTLNDQLIVSACEGLEDVSTLQIVFYSAIEPFFDTAPGANDGFVSRHLDFYTTCAMQHIADTWLRDFEWAALMQAKYESLKEAVRTFEMYRQYGNDALDMPIPGVIA
jgi:hypothetical protein